MAGCGDLENELRNLRRRVGELERCTGCGNNRNNNGGSNQQNRNIDIEMIIKRAVERVYTDRRWKAAEDCLEVIFRGKVS